MISVTPLQPAIESVFLCLLYMGLAGIGGDNEINTTKRCTIHRNGVLLTY